MKLSAILPILAAGSNERQHKNSEREFEQFVASEVTDECSDQFPSFGWSFQTTNDGFRGEVNLDNFEDNVNCRHDIHAGNRCREIKIKYRSVAVESISCHYVGFRFGWNDGTNDYITPARCDCHGDGCDDPDLDYYFYGGAETLGPTELTVQSNAFTFFFHSPNVVLPGSGHVHLDWECTSTPTTTDTM